MENPQTTNNAPLFGPVYSTAERINELFLLALVCAGTEPPPDGIEPLTGTELADTIEIPLNGVGIIKYSQDEENGDIFGEFLQLTPELSPHDSGYFISGKGATPPVYNLCFIREENEAEFALYIARAYFRSRLPYPDTLLRLAWHKGGTVYAEEKAKAERDRWNTIAGPINPLKPDYTSADFWQDVTAIKKKLSEVKGSVDLGFHHMPFFSDFSGIGLPTETEIRKIQERIKAAMYPDKTDKSRVQTAPGSAMTHGEIEVQTPPIVKGGQVMGSLLVGMPTVIVSIACDGAGRLRLYSNNGIQDEDRYRPGTTNPTEHIESGLLCDAYFGNGIYRAELSPPLDTRALPLRGTVYYTFENQEEGYRSFKFTVSVVPDLVKFTEPTDEEVAEAIKEKEKYSPRDIGAMLCMLIYGYGLSASDASAIIEEDIHRARAMVWALKGISFPYNDPATNPKASYLPERDPNNYPPVSDVLNGSPTLIAIAKTGEGSLLIDLYRRAKITRDILIIELNRIRERRQEESKYWSSSPEENAAPVRSFADLTAVRPALMEVIGTEQGKEISRAYLNGSLSLFDAQMMLSKLYERKKDMQEMQSCQIWRRDRIFNAGDFARVADAVYVSVRDSNIANEPGTPDGFTFWLLKATITGGVVTEIDPLNPTPEAKAALLFEGKAQEMSIPVIALPSDDPPPGTKPLPESAPVLVGTAPNINVLTFRAYFDARKEDKPPEMVAAVLRLSEPEMLDYEWLYRMMLNRMTPKTAPESPSSAPQLTSDSDTPLKGYTDFAERYSAIMSKQSRYMVYRLTASKTHEDAAQYCDLSEAEAEAFARSYQQYIADLPEENEATDTAG